MLSKVIQNVIQSYPKCYPKLSTKCYPKLSTKFVKNIHEIKNESLRKTFFEIWESS